MIINFDIEKYKKVFLEENAKYNLISKNDERLLYEKHIFDSLGIRLFFEKYNIKPCKILDIGCGGGFPCVPIALQYPEYNIIGLDSIKKKINAVNNIKTALEIKNLNLICDRAEYLQQKDFDIVVSRAVANLAKICEYALPKLKNNGYFIAYKSVKTDEEIQESVKVLKNNNASVIDILEYTLPLKEIYTRKLICIQKTH
ncbi:MAG: 16S rRNA (guanine(527)-N(7))-methyltransferase RsmG [bacterium]|nr:16S rRNA (guanine(527)-N(7))-methyltransferase RsmG [bacterium]